MVIFILLISLCVSFSVHFFSLVFYLLNRSRFHFNLFFGTALFNILAGIALSIFALKDPSVVRGLNLGFLLWIISGLVTFLLLSIKTGLAVKIYKRSKDPDYYHYNFFNKKVYSDDLVQKHELIIFFVTIPFFLLIGAYFIAKVINFYLHGNI